jgi:hypothetical protein
MKGRLLCFRFLFIRSKRPWPPAQMKTGRKQQLSAGDQSVKKQER